LRSITLLAFVLLSARASVAHGQTNLSGRVLEEGSERPVREAEIRLLDRDGEVAARAVSDVAGRWELEVPEAGEYFLAASRLGYEAMQSPMLSIESAPAVPLEILLRPSPIGLEGLRVEVDYEEEAEQQLKLAGVAPRDLGRRWISESDIEAVKLRRDVGSFIERQGIPALRVIRPENIVPGSDPLGLCVSLVRGRTAGGLGRCALGVVDGIERSTMHLLDLDPETVAAMAVLNPIEAVILFGKRGEAGAVMIWTKRGGPAR